MAEDGLISGYSCDQLIANNEVNAIELEFYYDLSWPKDAMDYVAAREKLESLLVREVASRFSIIGGSVCINPPFEGIWLVGANSAPDDEVNTVYDGCTLLEPDDGEDCEGFKGIMSAYAVGAYELDGLITAVGDSLISGTVTQGTELRTAFLGTELAASASEGKNNIAPAINDFSYEIPEKDNDFTALGGLLCAGIVLAFVGLLAVIYRRRRRSSSEARDLELDEDGKVVHQSAALGNTIASEDDKYKRAFKEEVMSDGTPAPEEFDERYTFDIGETLRNNLMNLHGQTSVRSFRRMGVEIDSDMESAEDSWAQTDATLGSLENRLGSETGEV